VLPSQWTITMTILIRNPDLVYSLCEGEGGRDEGGGAISSVKQFWGVWPCISLKSYRRRWHLQLTWGMVV